MGWGADGVRVLSFSVVWGCSSCMCGVRWSRSHRLHVVHTVLPVLSITTQAELAGKDFTAEKQHVIVISTGAVANVDHQRIAAERKEAEDRNRHRRARCAAAVDWGGAALLLWGAAAVGDGAPATHCLLTIHFSIRFYPPPIQQKTGCASRGAPAGTRAPRPTSWKSRWGAAACAALPAARALLLRPVASPSMPLVPLAPPSSLHCQSSHLTSSFCIPPGPEQERASFYEWRRDLASLEQDERLVLTPFEKNLEVWRQLWRVLERSDVVVQVRCGRRGLVG